MEKGCRERGRGGGRQDVRTTLITNTNNPRFWVSCRNGWEASEGSRAPNKKVLTPEDTMSVGVEGFRI